MTSVVAFRDAVLADRSGLREYLDRQYAIRDLQPYGTQSWNATFYAERRLAAPCFVKVLNESTARYKRSADTYSWLLGVLASATASRTTVLVPPICNADGQWLGRYRTRKIIVYPWIEHRPEDQLIEDGTQNELDVDRGAQVLARFHRYLDGTTPLRYWPSEPPQCQTPKRWAAHLSKIFQTACDSLTKQAEMDNAAVELLKHYENYTQCFVKANANFFESDQYECDFVHGDFRPENLLIDSSGNLHVIDYDLAHFGSLATDAVYGALSYSGMRWFTGPRNWTAFEQFIRAYHAACGAGALNIESLLVRVEWVVLRGISAAYKGEQIVTRSQLHQSFLDQYQLSNPFK
jgi:Ser/Thr protein kinase RdoA (MazF antagonist)